MDTSTSEKTCRNYDRRKISDCIHFISSLGESHNLKMKLNNFLIVGYS